MNEKIKHILAVAAGIISLLIYILTLSPTVTFMDSGELAASVYTFGIPHPTGYPLYLVLGYLTAHLPLGPSVIFRLNFFSAITSAIAVVVFYYAAIVFLSTFNVNKKIKKENEKKRKEPELSALVVYVISFFAALCFGLSRNFWGNAVVNEVYSLHSIFICLFILFSLKIYRNLSESPLKYWTLLFIFVGLSFSNHLTTVFLIPSLLYILFLQYRVSPLKIKKVLLRAFLIIPGLLIYIVLMIASASGPFFNWSNPVNLPNLFHHMSGGDFSHLFMASTGVFSKNLKQFAENFFNVYGIICTIILLIGYIFLYKRNKELFIFFTLLIAASIGFGLNYNVLDVENYFSLMFTSFGFCLALGIFELYSLARKKLKVHTASLQYLAVSGVILSGSVFITNYSINNHSKDYSAEDLTVNTLNNLKPNSVLVSYEWTNIYHSSLYFQKVEQSRPDVKVILIRLLAAPWYLNTLQKYYPDLYSNFSKEAGEYIANYDKDLNIQAPKLINMVKAFFRNNIGKFPMYITYDIFYNKDIPNLFSDYGWKPASLCYELTPKNEPYDSTAGMITLDYNFRPYSTDDVNKRKMKISTAGIYYDFAYYHYKNHNYQSALKLADKSLSIDNLPDAIKLKNIIINEAKNK